MLGFVCLAALASVASASSSSNSDSDLYGPPSPLNPLDERRYTDDFTFGDYVGAVIGYAFLIFGSFALIWPALHTRTKFHSLRRKYEGGRPVVGTVVEEADVGPAVTATLLSPDDGCSSCCCCSSTTSSDAAARAISQHQQNRLIVCYDSSKSRMVKSFSATKSTRDAAFQNGTVPLLLLPDQDKSAIPEYYLRTRSPFGCGRYALSMICGFVFLAWSAYFAAVAVLGGITVLQRTWEWGGYLSYAIVGMTTSISLYLSYLLCKWLTRREYKGYVDGGAVYFPSWTKGGDRFDDEECGGNGALSPQATQEMDDDDGDDSTDETTCDAPVKNVEAAPDEVSEVTWEVTQQQAAYSMKHLGQIENGYEA